MSSISPKSISKEQFINSYKNGLNVFFKYIAIYMASWVPVILSMYLALDIKYLIFLVVPITMLTVVASFELTCTLYVGYKGSFFNKLKVSFQAAAKNILKVYSSDFIWMSLLLFVFILPGIKLYITKENDPYMILYVAYFSAFVITIGYNIFNMLKIGIISMYVSNGDQKLVEELYLQSFKSNMKYASITLAISLCCLLFVSFVMWAFIFLASISAAISFFLFIEIFEPPQMKQTQEEKSEVHNAIPEGS